LVRGRGVVFRYYYRSMAKCAGRDFRDGAVVPFEHWDFNTRASGSSITESSSKDRDYNNTAAIIKMKNKYQSVLHQSIQAARLHHTGLQVRSGGIAPEYNSEFWA
jgi:hypothetical protein